MTKRRNIFLIGPMGAGKSSIGKLIARDLGLEFYDSDEVVEQQTGADIPWIFDIEGARGLQKREAKVIAELTKLNGIVLATGGGSVNLAENRVALMSNGIVIYLRTSFEEQIERTGRSKKRPLASEEQERRRVLENLRVECEPLYEELADLVYDTHGVNINRVANAIIQDLYAKKYF